MAGAAGYVLKQVRGADILGAVRTVAAGGSLLDPRTTSMVMQRLRDQASTSDPYADLGLLPPLYAAVGFCAPPP